MRYEEFCNTAEEGSLGTKRQDSFASRFRKGFSEEVMHKTGLEASGKS